LVRIGFALFIEAKTNATKNETTKSMIGKETPKEKRMLVTRASIAIKMMKLIKKFTLLCYLFLVILIPSVTFCFCSAKIFGSFEKFGNK
jgi:hypothetical protein